MSGKTPSAAISFKDGRVTVDNKAVPPSPAGGSAPRVAGALVKTIVNKQTPKEQALEMSPVDTEERTELLGSLTTLQHQRTSARVIKKLRLEPQPEKPGKRSDAASDEVPDLDTPIKLDEKELKFPTVKQRTPKALWSTDEKNLFFEALNEYGKDFDAITAYIRAKMKKKGMPDMNMKTKTQVSHFYYRTWHKLSKHVRFDGNVKKVAQELYALINYGELRKKLVSVNEKTCGRLGEMVLSGSIVVRARGRNLRVRTPMCRALRRLNQITELAMGSVVCGRAGVSLRARDAAAWARVQARAHNPRLHASLPLATPLAALLTALAHRWDGPSYKPSPLDPDREDQEEGPEKSEEERELEDHLNLEPDRVTVQGDVHFRKQAHAAGAGRARALHVGPRAAAAVHAPELLPSEPLSAHSICFSSYLERMDLHNHHAKIRTPKRQRKDSTTEKDKEVESKKFKTDYDKLINIEETAIDGIELMASYKNNQEDERPSTEDEKEIKSEETAEEEIEITDNIIKGESDIIKGDRDTPNSVLKGERDILVLKGEKDEVDMSEKEKDSLSEIEDDEKYIKSDTDNESDPGKSGKERKFKNLKVKFRIRPKKRGKSIYTMVMDEEKGQDDKEVKDEKDKENKEDVEKEREDKEEREKEKEDKVEIEEREKEDKSADVDLAIRQIRKGWSVHDAGDLTIGDLYLMFGNRSKLELDYWWAEPTPPLPTCLRPKPESDKDNNKPFKLSSETDKDGNKTQKTPDKTDLDDEKEKARESDTDIFSPKNTYSQDSNDGMSGDERKSENLASPDHKSSVRLKLVNKLINRPLPVQNNTETSSAFAQMSDRLKRLLSLAGNPSAAGARCGCGRRARAPPPRAAPLAPRISHPTEAAALDLSDVPGARRGRSRVSSRVVVQRLLPLLPKLPPPSPLIPVKMVPNGPPALPKILPKPPPTTTADLSFFYVVSESNGQFYCHDGDRKIPIAHSNDTNDANDNTTEVPENVKKEGKEVELKSEEATTQSVEMKRDAHETPRADAEKKDSQDIGNFLVSESLSLSPSRLLRDAEGWLDAAHDFSLSSFLGHLEGRAQPDLAVDSQLHSLLAESSVDYVAKFADLAAEVTAEPEHVPSDSKL